VKPTVAVSPNTGPEGAAQLRADLCQVFFIKFHPKPFEHVTKLVLKRYSPMVGLLILNIFDNRIPVTVGNGERSIAVLPLLEIGKKTILLDPLCGANFDGFHQIRKAYRRMKTGEDMQVIFHSIYTVQMTIIVFQYAPDVAEKAFSIVSDQRRLPVLGGEHDVIIYLGVGRHASILCDPFGVEIGFGCGFRGFTPTAIHVHPLRGWRNVRTSSDVLRDSDR